MPSFIAAISLMAGLVVRGYLLGIGIFLAAHTLGLTSL
jgi:hypothetical protein